MKLLDSVLTLGKVILKSRPAGKSDRPGKGKRLVIMGNGPSLRQTLDENREVLKECDTTAVNFAANTPEFSDLKPRHYVLADPHFFRNTEDPNVALLWQNLIRADWPFTLHVPASQTNKLPTDRLTVQNFNITPAEGYSSLCFPLFRKALAMPRPRNVLIPAIMEGIRDGYEEIYLVGADHTWPHSLYVDDKNRVVTVQPHFYEEKKNELDRIAKAYEGIPIYQVLDSMVVAFRSYHTIREYAEKEGVRIYNATPGSLIDAFTRKPL